MGLGVDCAEHSRALLGETLCRVRIHVVLAAPPRMLNQGGAGVGAEAHVSVLLVSQKKKNDQTPTCTSAAGSAAWAATTSRSAAAHSTMPVSPLSSLAESQGARIADAAHAGCMRSASSDQRPHNQTKQPGSTRPVVVLRPVDAPRPTRDPGKKDATKEKRRQPPEKKAVRPAHRWSLFAPLSSSCTRGHFFLSRLREKKTVTMTARQTGLCLWILLGIFGLSATHTACQSHHPQANVLSGLNRNAVGATVRLTPAAWYDPAVSTHARAVVATFPALVDSVSAMARASGGDGNLEAGIGLSPALWARWRSSLTTPVGMVDFPGYEGVDGWPRMPRTEGDLFVHAKAARRDVLYALVDLLVERVGASAVGDVSTVDAWTNALDGQNRDLTGFVDGTVNVPSGQRALAGLIGATADPLHVNGSFAIVQVWRHDLAAFGALNLTAQEAVFGRTKARSLPLAHQAPSSHVARVRQSALGYFIVRQAMPWGDPASAGAGLLFIAYSGDARRLDAMCRSMVGSGPGMAGAPRGVPDAIMRFSTPTTGKFWYFPSIEMLAQLAKQPVLA